MKRLHETSRGLVELDLERGTFEGTMVTVTLFGSDGWESDAKRWSSKYGHETREETLPAFLVRFVGLPQSEADSLANELLGIRLDEWSSRGGPQYMREIERLTVVMLIVLAVGAVLALVGLVAIIRVLIT